ncbi:MAG TPA: hypothetical protein VG537_10395 [Candidatus Kapabacteria bacterium]|jgi:hypothetical protein|nr:hypothetical protein [Candidatus Kapabacteria bacterium]
MKQWILPRAQQEELSKIISSAGLEYSEFELRIKLSNRVVSTKVSSLLHLRTGSYFDFDTLDRGGYYIEFSPGVNEPVSLEYSGQWSYVQTSFKNWIEAVKREISAKSPWQPFDEAKAFGRFAAGSENPAFNSEEKRLVVNTLDEVIDLISSKVSLPEERLRLIQADIAYLKESTERIGKKDFVLLFLGWGMDKALSNGIPPDVLSQVFQLVSERLHHVFLSLMAVVHYFAPISSVLTPQT